MVTTPNSGILPLSSFVNHQETDGKPTFQNHSVGKTQTAQANCSIVVKVHRSLEAQLAGRWMLTLERDLFFRCCPNDPTTRHRTVCGPRQ